MRQHGTVRDWKDDKGFGFITPTGGGRDVFLHISAVNNAARRPVTGDAVEFVTTKGDDGRVRAADVRIASATVTAKINPYPYLLATFCVGAGILLMMRTGLPIVLAYPIMGAITFAVYAQDKARAQAGAYRVPESTLHFLEILGGWFGGYLAQEWLRHKTIKDSYQSAFWGIVFLHCAGWALWLAVTFAGAIKQ